MTDTQPVTATAAGQELTFGELRQFVAEGEVAGVADDEPVKAGLTRKTRLTLLTVQPPQPEPAAAAPVAAPRPVPPPPPPAAM